MSNEKNEGDSVSQNRSGNCNNGRGSSVLAFSLVVTMLGILFVLLLLLLRAPSSAGVEDPETIMDFYKWALSVLLGTFGAWIGAGAAYFFGKENLKESSASTERAMEIQQKSLRRPSGIERVKDLTLTAMNTNFIFNASNSKSEVKQKLDKFKGYWFVPVVNENTGVLEDIIHAQVFWDPNFMKDDTTLKDIIAQMDKTESFKKLHGDSFYVKVSSNDKISDVYALMNNRGAEVAIVADENGKATNCITKTELRTFLKAHDN